MGNCIVGTGSYLPSAIVTNQDIMAMVDLSNFDPGRSGPHDQWGSRTMGFVERRWAARGQAASDLAHAAAASAGVRCSTNGQHDDQGQGIPVYFYAEKLPSRLRIGMQQRPIYRSNRPPTLTHG